MPPLQLKSQGMLSFPDEIEPLPSPKMKPTEVQGIHTWSHAYAGFSPDFAEAALRIWNVKASQRVIDPFSGSGTSAVAAARLGCKFSGADMDPFSALLAKAKTAYRVDIRRLNMLLDGEQAKNAKWSHDSFSPEAHSTFPVAALKYADTVFNKIKKYLSLPEDLLYQYLLENKDGSLSTELIAIAALLIAAKGGSTAARGSNPVWFKRDSNVFETSSTSFSTEVKATALRMLNDLNEYGEVIIENRIKIHNGDFSEMKLRPKSVDWLITSPPYLNRLDYIVSHLPELTLLSGFFLFNFEELRMRMMGTTKMLTKKDPDVKWGEICINALENIKSHKSVASSTYYYRFHTQYFSDLYRFIKWSKRVMKSKAQGLLVIQDSYYKDIRIPISEIIEQMGKDFEISVDVIRTDKRHNHIGGMNPNQRSYVKSKELHEKTLSLKY